MTRISLLLICVMALCNSCKKDDVKMVSAGRFESTANIHNDGVVLYTKGNTITDTQYIKAFLERKGITGVFALTPGSATSSIQVTFDNQTSDSIYFRVTASSGYSEFIFNDISYNNNTAVVLGRDSVHGSAVTDGELSCPNVDVLIRQHPGLSRCVPLGLFGSLICKERPQIAMVMNADNISLPVISYFFATGRGSVSCSMLRSYVFDQFNTDVVKTIHVQDTLVVQTRMLVLERK
jgi:hypothetical protein